MNNLVKCAVCNLEFKRITITHINSCSLGKISSIQEYKRKFPNSPIMSDFLKTKCSNTLSNFIIKYGEIDGERKFNEYREKQRIKNTFEFKQKKYDWTREQFDEFNKSRATTKENLIRRHGQIKGLEKWEKYIDRQRYTNTLDYFIERENDIEKGLDVFFSYNRKKGKCVNIDHIMSKYNVDRNGACEILSKRFNFGNFSSHAEEIFVDDIQKIFNENIKYSCKTRQFCIWSQDLNSPCFYDVCCPAKKKIIEYNGDYWHMNPLIYKSDAILSQANVTAKQVWDYDFLKLKAAADRGFKVLTIWESDYINNYEQTILLIKKFWYD